MDEVREWVVSSSELVISDIYVYMSLIATFCIYLVVMYFFILHLLIKAECSRSAVVSGG